MRESSHADLARCSQSSLPRTEKGEPHLHRRLLIARIIYDMWTSHGSQEAGLAGRFTDGSVGILEDFVQEAAMASMGITAETSADAMTIDRRHADSLHYEEFLARYMQPNRPVLIQGTNEGWPAARDWVKSDGGIDIDAMDKQFGNSCICATSTPRGLSGYSSGKRRHMSFHEFAKIWRSHSSKSENLYLKDWHFASEFPNYKAYTCPHYFTDDWLNDYFDLRHNKPGACQSQDGPQDVVTSDYRFVYLGRKGTWTPIHADVLRSYSWSTNVAGRKRWKLLPPQHTPLLMDRFGREMAPSFDASNAGSQYPNLAKAAELVIEIEQGPDEVLFVPSGWHHSVENVEDTLSINHNWLNGYNIHWSWELLCQEHAEATQAIKDCRALTDPQEFENLVQRNMEANCSFNYISMAHFMSSIALRQIRQLQSTDLMKKGEDIFQLLRCIFTLRELLKELCSAYKECTTLGENPLDAASIDVLQEYADQILLPDKSKSEVIRIISGIISVGEQSLEVQ